MAEPARKLDGYVDKERDLGPNLKAIAGGGNNLKAAEYNYGNKLTGGSVKDQESRGLTALKGGWDDKVFGVGNLADPKGGFLFKAKKRSPIAIIIVTVLGGGLGITALLSPSLLLVHFKEMLVERSNTQLSAMELRTRKMIYKKVYGTVTGFCTSKVSIKCKYSTMSKKQVDKFKAAGIDIQGKTTIAGRIKPSSMNFAGVSDVGPTKTLIKAKDFQKMYVNNTAFRSAVQTAYNPKFAGFADAPAASAFAALKISKKAPDITGASFKEKMTNLAKDIREKTKASKMDHVKSGDLNEDTPEPGDLHTEDTANSLNSRIDDVNGLIEQAGGDVSVMSKIKGGVSGFANAIKITGVADDLCSIYRTFRAVGFAAKTVRVLQTAAFAMMFMNIPDQIKAGTAKDTDVSFAGEVLTKTIEDDDGTLKSATDSDGYRYASEGITKTTSTSTMQYMAAAGLTGSMINFFESFPGATKKTCSTLANPLVGIGSFITGAAVAVFSAGGSLAAKGLYTTAKTVLKKAAKEAAKSPGFWASAGLGFAEIFLPGLLKDIIAGNTIDENTVGSNAGNAITSGAGGIMGTTAKYGGNAPLTPDQAVAYTNLSKEVIAEYAETERLASNPFDATNGNTFMGKIVRSVIPYTTKMSSLSGIFTSIASMISKSFAVISPSPAKAASTDDFTTCQDEDYRDLNLATDPFCNVIYGIPPEALDIDPEVVADKLSGQYDEETGAPIVNSDYDNFVYSCINRTSPLGYDDNGSGSDGKECLFNDTNKYYYLFYIDQRVLNGMESENENMPTSTAPTTVAPADVLKYCTANYGKYSSQENKMKIFGSSPSEVRGQLVTVQVPLASGMKNVAVHQKAAPCFKAAAQDIQNISHRPVVFSGTYVWREIRGYEGTGKMSNHSWGTAIDFDSNKNRMGKGTYPNCETNMPADFVAIWKRFGFRWGGDYKGRCDAMHFEWMGGAP